LINFLTFRSNALQSLALQGASLPNYWTKDDIERWILKSYKQQAPSARAGGPARKESGSKPQA